MLQQPRRLLWPWRIAGLAFAVLILVLVGGGIGLHLLSERRQTAERSLAEASVLARSMAAQASALFNALNQAMIGLGAAARRTGAEQAQEALEALAIREAGAPEGVTLAILSSEGRLLLASEAGRRRIAGLDLDDFEKALAALAAGQGGMRFGPPVRSTVGPALPLWHPLPGGQEAVLALLPLRLFEGFYDRLLLPPGNEIALIDGQGRLLARMPSDPDRIGLPAAQAVRAIEILRLQENWSGLSRTEEGGGHFTAVVPVPGQPGVVSVGLSEAAAFAAWRNHAGLGVLLTLLITGVAGSGVALVLREARQRLEAQDQATARLEWLARGSAQIARIAELPVLLEVVARLARETTGAPFAALMLLNQPMRRPAESRGAEPAPGRFAALGRWIAGLPGEPVVPEGRLPPREDLPARMALPLREEDGGAFAVLVLAEPEGGFNADGEAMLDQLARLAEVAIRNRRLITALHGMADEANGARERVEHILDSISDGFIALDAEWRMTYANGAALGMIGVASPALLGLTLWERFPSLLQDEAFALLHTVASRGAHEDFTVHLQELDRWFRMVAHPAGDGVAIFLSDITGAQQARQRQFESQRTEVIGRLASGAARDLLRELREAESRIEQLRGTIADITGGAPSGLLRDGTAALMATRRGLEMAGRMLDFASLTTAGKADPHPATLLRNLEPLLRAALPEAVTLRLVVKPGLPRPRLPAWQFENAVVALVLQARDLMTGAGRVEITLTGAQRGHGSVHPWLHCRISASDAGGGERSIPFLPGESRGELRALQEMVHQAGGTLKLDRGPTSGFSAALALPGQPPPGSEACIPRTGEAGARILLVEDEAPLRHVLTRQLQSLGCTVVGVEAGPEALKVLEEGFPADLLLTDMIMPGGMSGRQLVREARRHRRNLPALLISGYALSEERLGPQDLLLAKPCSQNDLARHLRRLLEPVDPSQKGDSSLN